VGQRDDHVQRRGGRHAYHRHQQLLGDFFRGDRERLRHHGRDRHRHGRADPHWHEHLQRRHYNQRRRAAGGPVHIDRHARLRRGRGQCLAGILPHRYLDLRQRDLGERHRGPDRGDRNLDGQQYLHGHNDNQRRDAAGRIRGHFRDPRIGRRGQRFRLRPTGV